MSVLPNITVEAFFNLAWTDLSAYVRSGQITRGSSRYDGTLVRYEAGTASVVLDNRDGRFDPTWLAGPYGSGVDTQILPGAIWRIRSTSGSGYTLWSGTADSWELSYPSSGKDATCLLRGTDYSRVFQRGGLSLAADPFALSGTIIGAVLSAYGFSGDVDAGNTLVQGGTITADNAWEFMQLVADTELGELYVSGDGTVVFRQRQALFEDSRSATSQGTFGDSGSELRYQDVHVTTDDVQLKNLVQITFANGGTEQTASESNSIGQFGTHSYSRTDLLLTTDVEALEYAKYVVAISSGTITQNGTLLFFGDTRIDSLSVDPRTDPTHLNQQVLGRELGDRITVKARPVGRGSGNPIVRDAFIRGISHTFGPESWQTTWVLQDATRFAVFVFDDAVLGRFDYDFFGF